MGLSGGLPPKIVEAECRMLCGISLTLSRVMLKMRSAVNFTVIVDHWLTCEVESVFETFHEVWEQTASTEYLEISMDARSLLDKHKDRPYTEQYLNDVLMLFVKAVVLVDRKLDVE